MALNTILCGQESGGTCVNPHINDAGEDLNRAETVAERLMKFLPNCVCLKEFHEGDVSLEWEVVVLL